MTPPLHRHKEHLLNQTNLRQRALLAPSPVTLNLKTQPYNPSARRRRTHPRNQPQTHPFCRPPNLLHPGIPILQTHSLRTPSAHYYPGPQPALTCPLNGTSKMRTPPHSSKNHSLPQQSSRSQSQAMPSPQLSGVAGTRSMEPATLKFIG